ncbi:unnamed protein product, partial [Nesidiocoris tenuis]
MKCLFVIGRGEAEGIAPRRDLVHFNNHYELFPQVQLPRSSVTFQLLHGRGMDTRKNIFEGDRGSQDVFVLGE